MITRLSLNRCSREYLDDNKAIHSILTAKGKSIALDKKTSGGYLSGDGNPTILQSSLSGTAWGIGSRGELIYVNIYIADNSDIDGGGTRICWKPEES